VSPSPAYGAQASAIQLRTRPGDVAGPVQQSTPIGSPATVIAALKKWEEIGVDRMVFLVNFDQVIPHRKILESFKRFAREVMPAFAEAPKPSLTRVPDFAAVENVGVYQSELAAGGA